MEFIETPTFARMLTYFACACPCTQCANSRRKKDVKAAVRICELFTRRFADDIIKGGGGIRKLHYAAQGRGKSGGVRVIYYWVKDNHQNYMLVVYPKSKKDISKLDDVAGTR